MSLYYSDTSAVIKLLAEETHSRAFAAFYDAHADAEWVSSALLRIEVTRTVARVMPALLPDARDLLLAFSTIAIDGDVVEGAMNEPDRALRSLDAIHLATARILGPDLDAVVSYDDRLIKTARVIVVVADWERNGTSGVRDDRDGFTRYQRSRPHATPAPSGTRP